MASHEFGIMQNTPLHGQRYVQYDPWEYDRNYDCVYVEDDCLTRAADGFSDIDFYWHTVDVKEKGIAYYGITLVPPESMEACIDVIKDVPGLSELKTLLETAHAENRWIIHFGL